MKSTRYPGIQRLSDGRYRVRVKVTDPKTGIERDIRTVISAASLIDANARREQLRARAEALDEAHRRERLRLGDYAETWLRAKLPSLAPSTRARYANELDHHILPTLGNHYLDAITPADVLAWRDAQRGSPSSINARLRTLRMLVRDAVAELDLPRDPCARVRGLREPHREDVDANCLSADDLRRVLHALEVHQPQWHAIFATLAFTGARFGEVSALKWEDIDDRHRTIRIRRAHWRGVVGSTKTRTTRTIPLHESLRAILSAHRRRLIATQNPGLSEGWVFPSSTGSLLLGPSLRKPLRRALREAELHDRLTVHGFRRTFNNLVRQVTTGEVLRSMTGHVTVAMTEHYSHVEADEKRRAVDRALGHLGGGGTSGGTSGP